LKAERVKDYDLFIEKGWTYNPTTGELFSHMGKSVKATVPVICNKSDYICADAARLCYYMHAKELPLKRLMYKNGDKKDWRFENLYFQEKKVKEKKERVKKERVVKLKSEPKKSKIYIIDTELLYEIIISQGRGKITNKLERMLFDICKNVTRKFSYNSENDKYDCMMGAYLHVIQKYKNFDVNRGAALPYITELIKRSLVNNFNILIYHKYIPAHDRQHFISINNYY
jgi:hypothetical protein